MITMMSMNDLRSKSLAFSVVTEATLTFVVQKAIGKPHSARRYTNLKCTSTSL